MLCPRELNSREEEAKLHGKRDYMRGQLRVLDKIVFKSFFQSLYRRYLIPIELSKYRTGSQSCNSIVVSYRDESRSPLNFVCDDFNTDKGSMHPRQSDHAYVDIYDILLRASREHIRNIFECGIGSNNIDVPGFMGENASPGASLRVWRDFFPKAHIWGADIDQRILFEEQRISTGYLNQLDSTSIENFWEVASNGGQVEFDLMIDDGLHTVEAANNLFVHSVSHLKKDGYYFIEDLSYDQIQLFTELIKDHPFSCQVFSSTAFTRGLIPGNLLLIRRK